MLVSLPSKSIYGHHSPGVSLLASHCREAAMLVSRASLFKTVFFLLSERCSVNPYFLIEWSALFKKKRDHNSISRYCAIDLYSSVFMPLTNTVMFITSHMLRRVLFCYHVFLTARLLGRVVFTCHWFFSFHLFLVYSDWAFSLLYQYYPCEELSDLHQLTVSFSPHLTQTLWLNCYFLEPSPQLTLGQHAPLALHFWGLVFTISCCFYSFTSHAGGFLWLNPWAWSFPSPCLLYKWHHKVSWVWDQVWTFLNSRIVCLVGCSMFYFNI